MGHIQWSPLAVDKAMDQVQESLEPIFIHLDQAYEAAKEASKQPNLPQYMTQALSGVQWAIGAIRREPHHPGNLLNAIDRVRSSLPEENLKAEKDAARHGTPLTLGV